MEKNEKASRVTFNKTLARSLQMIYCKPYEYDVNSKFIYFRKLQYLSLRVQLTKCYLATKTSDQYWDDFVSA